MTRGIIFTHSELKGDLKPLYIYPSTLEENLIHKIIIKSSTLVLTTLDLSIDYEGASILQFPELTVLVYYFLHPHEENGTKSQIPTTISVFVESEFEWFFFKEVEPLVQRIKSLVQRIRNTGQIMEEEFKELYNFLDSVLQTDEMNENKQTIQTQAIMKPVYISDQQGFLDYYPFINLDLREEIVSRLIEGDSSLDELSKDLKTSSFEVFPLLQRLLRYKLISLQNSAISD
ncbi:hypothetical protein [Candidatus Borrarchaeum sp.]|uniref:hypothetical protein n=1 Tax=Candidatus Borrarchaeum sp. TaxID=2846742 RepID=UPI0025803E91|nr:hypothetical protein [Candidatus Borrarchaeum sp.]